MVAVAQLVRASVCGAEGRRFEPGHPPKRQKPRRNSGLFLWGYFSCENPTILGNHNKKLRALNYSKARCFYLLSTYFFGLSTAILSGLLAKSQAITKANWALFAKASYSILLGSSPFPW